MVNEPDAHPTTTSLERRSKEVLDASVEQLQAGIRSRLTQARYAAIAEAQRAKTQPWRRWAPAVGIAAAAALAVLLTVQSSPRPTEETAALLLEDFDLVADAENLELLEDIEFYAWLDSQAESDIVGDQSG